MLGAMIDPIFPRVLGRPPAGATGGAWKSHEQCVGFAEARAAAPWMRSCKRGSRHSVAISLALLAAVIAILTVQPTLAQEPSLIEQEPFDVIKLKDGSEVKVLLIDLPNRRVPKNPAPSDSITVRRVDDPTNQYQIFWKDIVSIDLFEQFVLREAEQFVKDAKFDRAFDNYAYLYNSDPNLEGLAASAQRMLVAEAQAAFAAQNDDRALMLLLELYEQNPKYPGLKETLDRVGDRLIAEHMKEARYAKARTFIQLLKQKFPGEKYERLDNWRQQLISLASEQLAAARKHFAAKEYRQAKLASNRATEIWPELAGVRELERQVQVAYPQVLVGVVQQTGQEMTDRMDDWASRRAGRLLERKLLELTDYTSEGGEYQCPLGELTSDATGRRLTISLRDDIHWSSGSGLLTAHDVARVLLRMSDPDQPNYSATWSRLLEGISVENVFQARIDLRRFHVRPESLLETSIDGVGQFAERSRSGPYDLLERHDTEVTYRANDQYFAAAKTQPREVIEIQFESADRAVAALKRGTINVVDRVPARLLPTVQADPNLAWSEYALPTIHVLIPNRENEYLKQSAFRRAICYAIDRQAILDQLILGGERPRGFAILSGPMPRGRGIDDPLSFAYDSQVEPRPFDSRAALMLVNLTRRVLAEQAKKRAAAMGTAQPDAKAAATPKKNEKSKAAANGTSEDDKKKTSEAASDPPLEPIKPLTLAYPSSTIARDVCDTIRQQLELVDIPCQLIELAPGDLARGEVKYDLLYAELAFWEPVVDARRLLGADGLTGGCSAYMDQALRSLDAARNWGEVRSRLREVHRIAHREATVIPLWQTVNYFAYRKTLQNVGQRPVTLYQNVEAWQTRIEP